MGIPTNSSIRALGYMALSNFWYVNFTTKGNLLVNDFLEPDLPIRCKSIDAPRLSNPHKTASIRGNKLVQPGNSQYGGNVVNLVFYETLDFAVTQAFMYWRSVVQNFGNIGMGSLKEVACEMIVNRCDSQGNPFITYSYHNCILEEFNIGSPFNETATIIAPTATLMFDYFEEETVGEQ